jgi:ubiquinone biosynthesis monooxygenase Coq7
MSRRTLSPFDQLITLADKALRTLSSGSSTSERASPAGRVDAGTLNEREQKHAAGLMRVNHTGEVCAQALYQGQALTAKLPEVRQEMEKAAAEEEDHLVWCEQRLQQLDSHTSFLNPLWYTLSFGIGAGAGLISDKVSLGFVAATEDQVCKHLEEHLQRLPEGDLKSRRVVEQMLVDEARHAHTAIEAGGLRFPGPVKGAMSLASKAMTSASYRI